VTEYIKLDPGNTVSKSTRHIVIFKDGCTEDWINWLMAFLEIESYMSQKEPADKIKMFRTLMKGRALGWILKTLLFQATTSWSYSLEILA
jgi:hypothetical protein